MAASSEIATNRKALRDYHIGQRFEAGLVLTGTEVKSVRLGKVNINDAFARVQNGSAVLMQADIQPYERASFEQHVPRRERRLLLHSTEIEKIRGLSEIQGNAIVALRMYWKGNRVKLELAVGKGKDAPDKRADLKARANLREAQREAADFNRRHGV